MAFLSCEEMLAAARSQKITLAEAVLRSDLEESRLTEAHSRAAMRHLWQVMQATSQEYDPTQRSRSGLSGGDAAKVEQAWQQGRLLGDDYLAAVTAEALKTAECNACMKRIVAAPTAGSCGVLPAVLLPLARAGQADEDAVCDALYVAAGFGQVIAARATLAGAEGGCQAEVGAASAMAAAALCNLKGGTPEQCAAAAAMALGNLLGLVCDPVAGLVEVPCIKRNVVGAVNAVSCANMALAGVDYAIPCDEVIDAMGRVGSLLSPDLRETGQGGLAATPTGVKIARQLAQEQARVRVIAHAVNQNLGGVVKTAIGDFLQVSQSGDLMCLMDGDDTHKPRFIHGMLAKITREKQCVIASRYQPGARVQGLQASRKLFSDGARLYYTLVLHVPGVKDYTCGYRVYTRPALQAGVARYGQALVEKKSFACMMELLYKLYRCGCTFAEVPFTLYYDSKEGESKMNLGKTIRDSFLTALRLRVRG